MISIVILTFNEALNIQRCLDSVKWSDDIVLMDSGSTDATVQIAENFGARILTRKFDTFANQRNYAMQAGNFRNPWVLHLDADEVVTDALRHEMQSIVESNSNEFPVYRVPAKIIFMNKWLKHAGMYPSYQVRFGRSEDLRFLDHGHGQRETQSTDQVGTLMAPLDHYNFSKGMNDWFSRHLRYAKAEAEQSFTEQSASIKLADLISTNSTQRRRALKMLSSRMPFRPTLRFIYVYLFRGGFLDGRAGFDYALMMAIYQHFIDINQREIRIARENI